MVFGAVFGDGQCFSRSLPTLCIFYADLGETGESFGLPPLLTGSSARQLVKATPTALPIRLKHIGNGPQSSPLPLSTPGSTLYAFAGWDIFRAPRSLNPRINRRIPKMIA